MGLNAVGSSLLSPASDNVYQNRAQKRDTGAGLPQKNYAVDAQLVSEYYSSKSVSFDYTSKDGDTVSFSMESVEYSKSVLNVSAEGNKDDMDKLIENIKNTYDQMKKEVLNGFLKSIGVDVSETDNAKKSQKTKTLEIPEYWNAENTSQRIVDFAVAFSGIFEGSGEEFLSTIKGAIEEGFKQARDLLGDLPGQVSSLVDDTYKQVMEKLDAWAKEQGIAVPQPTEEVVV